MNSLLSKFNLYEFFRIILPGGYLVSQIVIVYNISLREFTFESHWSITALLVIIISFLLGAFVYALDVARLFKHHIDLIPTNLIREDFPISYSYYKIDERELEHEYYHWYEQTQNKSKSKTELQSSLYHFALNFSFCSIIGFIMAAYSSMRYLLDLNSFLFIISAILARTIVQRRLKYQWQRNYWEFRYEFIKRNSEK